MDEDVYRLIIFFSKRRNKFLLIQLSNTMKGSMTENSYLKIFFFFVLNYTKNLKFINFF